MIVHKDLWNWRFGRCAFAAAFVLMSLGAFSEEGKQTVTTNELTPEKMQNCNSLTGTDFSGIQDASAQVTEAVFVASSDAWSGYCRVTGYVSSQVGIKVGLPTTWNGKFLELGCDGHCGTLDNESFLEKCSAALRKGYACITSDAGHRGAIVDAVWSRDSLTARMDWGFRAPHVVALAGKAILQRFYNRAPAYAYFSGCSTGGREALQEAQRFPWDFDGIIAGDPPIRLADLYVTFAWGQRVGRDASGKPLLNIDDLKLLTEGALKRCDMDDGLKDGIISWPFECPFRPADLACNVGHTSKCLAPDKIRVAEQIYSGPVDHQGRSLFGAGAVPGSETGEPALERFGGNWGIYYLGSARSPALYGTLTQEGLKYLFFSPAQQPSWTIQEFDFDRDYKRLDVMESLYDSSNPDLSRFKNEGGKLLIYEGLNDLSVLPQWVIQYFEKVQRVLGGTAQTQAFARMFLLPGVEHCDGGPGADTVDYLTYLENWVERGEAPEKLIAAHLKNPNSSGAAAFPLDPAKVAFTRPVFPYPTRVRYSGHGDPHDAANFIAVTP